MTTKYSPLFVYVNYILCVTPGTNLEEGVDNRATVSLGTSLLILRPLVRRRGFPIFPGGRISGRAENEFGLVLSLLLGAY